MNMLPLRIVKVGCSLLERRQLPAQLRAWIQTQPAAIHILMAGGGELADSIRTWDQRFALGEVESHWLCIDALGITAQVLQKMLAEFPLLREYTALQQHIAELQSRAQPAAIVFDVRQFLREVEPTAPPRPLPHAWRVTTDSIAARLAEMLAAEELVLLKSRRCPEEPSDLAVLAAQGYVDEYFPEAAKQLTRVTLCQL